MLLPRLLPRETHVSFVSVECPENTYWRIRRMCLLFQWRVQKIHRTTASSDVCAFCLNGMSRRRYTGLLHRETQVPFVAAEFFLVRHTCPSFHWSVQKRTQTTDGGGFFLACENFCENVRPAIPLLRFFSKWRLARAHKFYFSCQD